MAAPVARPRPRDGVIAAAPLAVLTVLGSSALVRHLGLDLPPVLAVLLVVAPLITAVGVGFFLGCAATLMREDLADFEAKP